MTKRGIELVGGFGGFTISMENGQLFIVDVKRIYTEVLDDKEAADV